MDLRDHVKTVGMVRDALTAFRRLTGAKAFYIPEDSRRVVPVIIKKVWCDTGSEDPLRCNVALRGEKTHFTYRNNVGFNDIVFVSSQAVQIATQRSATELSNVIESITKADQEERTTNDAD